MSGLISAGPLLRCHVPGIRYHELQTIVNTDQLRRTSNFVGQRDYSIHRNISPFPTFLFSPLTQQITFHPRCMTPPSRSSVILPFLRSIILLSLLLSLSLLSFIFVAIYETRYTFQREASKFRLAAKRLSRVTRFPFDSSHDE